jgi:hypothetical protein
MWHQTKTIFLAALVRAAEAMARLLPGLLAVLLILIITVPLALLSRAAVHRLCTRLALDRRLREWGMAQPASAGRTAPSALIARVTMLTVLVLGFLLGLSVIETAATSTLAVRLLAYVPHALAALVLVLAGVAVSRAAERSVLIGAVNMGLQSARLLGLGARWLVVILAIAMAIEQLGLGGTILVAFFAILFGGIVLALALAVGLGAKDAVARSLERHMGSPAAGATAEEPEGAGAGKEVHHL